MKLIKRGAWGAKHGCGSVNITPALGGVAVHSEAGQGGQAGHAHHSECAGVVRGIERRHVRDRGWAGIAYNLLVCRHGDAYEGRGVRRRPAANGTRRGNQNFYAVCALVGPGGEVTAELLDGVRDAILYLRRAGGAGRRLVGHRDLAATPCPGAWLYDWLQDGLPIDGKPLLTPEPPPWPGRVLQYDGGRVAMRGEDVRTWQTRMYVRGRHITVDGCYGPQSAAVAMSFQREMGFDATGAVHETTWRAAWTKPIT